MAALNQRLAELDDMGPPRLRELWVKLTNSPAPRISPKLLRLAIAWEIQASGQGGLSRATQQCLAQLARGKSRTRQVSHAAARAGMRLVRVWNGKAHVVTIGDDQVIRWNDREWRSRSEVARTITGTRWSGPAFFGLKKQVGA